jgi:hypothetical protein
MPAIASEFQQYLDLFKGEVTEAAFIAWIEQFEEEDRATMLTLVGGFRYFSLQDVFLLLDKLYAQLRDQHGFTPGSTWFVPCGYVAKSGDAVAYFFKRRNALPDNSFLRASDLTESRLRERPNVVFIDDFVGSGQLVARTIEELVVPLRARVPEARFVFGTMLAMERGVRRFYGQTQLGLCTSMTVGTSAEPFSEDSVIFRTTEARRDAEMRVRKYTERLSPKSPLGYGGSQALIGFFFGTPNNTLPIFWRSSPEWRPLLPHGDALHDPRRLIDVPGDLEARPLEARGPTSDDDLQDISREATSALFDSFQTLQNMRVAARVFGRRGFHDSVLVNLLRAIQHLADVHHEKRPVASALLVAREDQISALATTAFVAFDPPLLLNDLASVATAANLIDGVDGALLVSPAGTIHGVRIHPQSPELPETLLPPSQWRAAFAASGADGALILFAGSGRVSIFDGVTRVLTRRDGKWHASGLPTALHSLEAEHGLTSGLMQKALRAAFTLADRGCGAMLVLGDTPGVSKFASKVSPKAYRWLNVGLDEPLLSPLVYAARQDGASLLDDRGRLHVAMAILKPPPEARAEEEPGKGARHTIAALISSVSGAAVLVISEEGPISIYSKGARVLRIMG